MSLMEADLTEREAHVFPTSLAQQRLWFLNQLEPDSVAYNISFAIRIAGDLKVHALEKSLRALVNRHEILRTTFCAVEGRPVQVVAPHAELILPIIDISGWPKAVREDRARGLARDEAQRLFDLARGPLLRTTLLRLAEAECILLLSMHHIVADGWSMNVFVNETAALYDSFRRDESSPLAELPLQYSDYSIWQREWLKSGAAESQLSYWRQHLNSRPALLDLQFDHPRTAVESSPGLKQSIVLDAELTERLRRLSRQEHVTIFMTLLAAFQTLLYRYTNQVDISVGSTIAGRDRKEIEGLIGCFLNTLVLRTDLSGDPTFRELLHRVREVALAAYANQDVPVEMLLDELRPERHLNLNPLFQVMFILQNTPHTQLQLADVTLSLLPNDYSTPKFDLTLDLTERPQDISGFIEYRTELFETESIARFAQQFRTLLGAIVECPERRVSQLRLLTAAEEQQLLVEFASSGKSAGGSSGLCLHELFEAQAQRTPAAVAVSGAGEELTYEELLTRSRALSSYLLGQGLRSEQLVGICMERTPRLLVAMLGVLQAGGAYVPLDPGYPQERLSWILADAKAAWLLTDESLRAGMGGLGSECAVLSVESVWEERNDAAEAVVAAVSPGQLAYVIYTSGSTGRPKGVAIEHQSIVTYVETAGELFAIKGGDRVLQFASISFDTSAEEIYPALAAGATLVLRTDEMLSSGGAFMRQCGAWGITVLDLPTSYWHSLALALSRGEAVVPESLRLVILGGEKAQRERWRQWQEHGGGPVRVSNTYGPTEATVVATSYEVNELGEGAAEIPIGRAVRHAETYVLDGQLQPVPIGVAGELYLGGLGLGRGYQGGPALTAEKFVPHPFSGAAGARLYQTGDRVRYSAAGQLEFLGRMDQQLKLRGYRIEPGEIETALRAHAGVEQALVLLREAGAEPPRLVAYVQPSGAQKVSGSELRGLLQQQLPAYMVPSALVLLEQLPRTASGKVDRAALPEPGQFQSESFVAPRNPLEELVAEIWSQVLKLPQVGVADNFFHLGGHSLLATQVISRVREVFGVEVSLRRLFEEPTLRDFSRTIEDGLLDESGVKPPALKRLEAAEREQWRGGLPLSFAQQRLWFLDQLQPDSVSYNVPQAVRLKGELGIEALERALSKVVRRHEVLRTRFVSVGGEPRQEVLPAADVKLAVTDLRKIAGSDQEAELERLVREEAQVPFDLSRGPVLRAVLYQLAEDEHILQITIHHIVGDGWSIGVLIRELCILYEAAKKGERASLPELPIQYADFAIWQREYLQGETLQYHVDYWKRELAGTTPLQLPTDNRRPQLQRFRGSEERFIIPADLTASLKALTRHEDITLFMVLLAAFQVLLHRYTEQSDITIGADIANRNRIETEGLIGFFVNLMVLRVDVSDDPTFRELLKRVRRISLDAYAHQDLPLEKLVEVLQPERSLSNNPLFQVVFVLQNQPMPSLEVSGLRITPIAVDSGMVQFDLILSITETGNELQGRFSYDIDLFIPATIKQLARRFRVLLESIVANPHERLSNLRFLSEEETSGYSHKSFPEASLSQKEFQNLVLEIGNAARQG